MKAMPTDETIRKSNQYYPWWLDNLADDVTGEGAAMQGVLQGAENVPNLVTEARNFTSRATTGARDISRNTLVKSRANPLALS